MTGKDNRKNSPRLELLGIGSANDRKLKDNLSEALKELAIEVDFVEVRDIVELLEYGISGIPALVIDGKVVFQKVVPSVEELKIVLNILLNKSDLLLRAKNIIVPTDFSETAENAFRFAFELAASNDGNVRLVHIHQPVFEIGDRFRPEPGKDEISMKKKLMAAFISGLRAKRKIGEASKHKIKGEIISGNAVDEIQRLSTSEQTDLIVMGTTGSGKLMGRWFGSISSNVAQKAHCPVILIPAGVAFNGFRNIVYASNYHPAEESILPQVVGFAKQFQADVHFAHIDQDRLNGYKVTKKLYGQISKESDSSFNLTSIVCTDILQGLNRYAKEQEADLMIMVTEHRNLMEELFHKSITRKMMFNTKIPLMVLHF